MKSFSAAHRLAIGRNHVELIDLLEIFRIARRGNQAVYRHQVDRAAFILPGPVQAPGDHFGIMGCADAHTENIVPLRTGNGDGFLYKHLLP